MIRYSYTKLVTSAFILGMLLSFSSCGFSEPGEPTQSYLTIQLNVPDSEQVDQQQTGTRHNVTKDPGHPNEKVIGCVAFFVFNAQTNVREQYQFINTDAGGNNPDPMWDPVTKSLRIPVTAGKKHIYCIANLANFTHLELGVGKSDLNDITNRQELKDLVVNHLNRIVVHDYIVMTGELENVTIAPEEQRKEIDMTRHVSRIDIYPMITPELKAMGVDFRIFGVKFKGLAGRSYLFPKGTSPTNTQWEDEANYNGTNSVVTATNRSEVQYYEAGKLYYTPEYYGTQATGTRMYIAAIYNNVMTYYSIKLSDPDVFTSNPGYDQGGATNRKYAVERNHIYRYYITFKGKGVDIDPSTTRAASGEEDNISYELEIKELK